MYIKKKNQILRKMWGKLTCISEVFISGKWEEYYNNKEEQSQTVSVKMDGIGSPHIKQNYPDS